MSDEITATRNGPAEANRIGNETDPVSEEPNRFLAIGHTAAARDFVGGSPNAVPQRMKGAGSTARRFY